MLAFAMSARAWTLFAAVSTLWGIPYLFIKIAVNGGVTPGVLAWGRITLASFVLLGLARRSDSLGSLRGRWRWLVLYGIVEVSIPFPLIAAGEQHVSPRRWRRSSSPPFRSSSRCWRCASIRRSRQLARAWPGCARACSA